MESKKLHTYGNAIAAALGAACAKAEGRHV